MKLTVARVRELFTYDPEEGLLRRKTFNARKSSVAGSLNGIGYWQIGIDGHNYNAHRVIWLWYYGKWPNGALDHRDRDRSNNRIANLRLATASQNNTNTSRTNATGFRGVVFFKPRNCWQAQIRANNKREYLGYFSTPEEAGAAYRAASKRLHGEFAVSDEVAKIHAKISD